MSRRFQTRRASRVGNSQCTSCSQHPRATQAPTGNTRTAEARATGSAPATSSTAPQANDQVKLSTKQEENAGGAQASSGFGSFLGNLTGNLGDLTKKLTPLQLNDQDKALIGKAQEVHRKLAGADGVWDASDKARNLQQMQGDLGRIVDQKINEQFQERTQGRTRIGTRFKQAVGRMHMKNHYGEYKAQGMGQANAQARAGLDDGQRQLGIAGPGRAHGPEPVQPLTVAELETFGQGMKRLEQLGREQGKPHARFTNGLPNQFFSDVLGGKLIPAGVDLTP